MNDIRALGVNDNADQPTLGRPATATQAVAAAVEKLRRARRGTRTNGVRTGLVNAIRERIASGEYDTADKLNAAVDAMIDDFVS
jgi:hypothetical protein